MAMFRRMLAALAVSLLCATAAAQEDGLVSRAMEVYEAFESGQCARIAGWFDETMASFVDEETLQAGREDLLRRMGAMTGATLVQAQEDERVAVLLVSFDEGQALFQVAFDGEGRISGLYIQTVDQPQAEPLTREPPEGAQTLEAVLFSGTPRELRGEIVVPPDADEATPYVVFAHGSGPSDRDETVGANKPFRDLAYDLAALGVGSLRFDKITYAAPDWPVRTVEQEYLEPVAEALRVLRERTQARRVYLVGHSEGGMIAPYLVAECGFDGGVSLAGTPLQLWEISRAQNLALAAMMEEGQREAVAAQVEEQTRLALTLEGMSDEEAEAATVFGMSAVYLQHLARMDQAQLARESGKPFLFLWGEKDAQVDRTAFDAWSERLGDGPYAYRVYERLNHLFIPAQEGENLANLTEAYGVPSRVDGQVARDIADWIAAQR